MFLCQKSMFLRFHSILISSALIGVASAAPFWSYSGNAYGPSAWYTDYPVCRDRSKSRQSPININTDEVSSNTFFPDFVFQDFDKERWMMLSVYNNRHTAGMYYVGSSPTIAGGGLQNPYFVRQVSFHWGSNNSQGAEHTLDGKTFPMEMHIVSYNTRYSNMGLAMSRSDGMAILAFHFQITNRDNKNYKPLIDLLRYIRSPTSQEDMPAISLRSLMARDLNDFYRYNGSMTAPGCYECVIWTIFADQISISNKQLDQFRLLTTLRHNNDIAPLVNNFRPVQSPHGRKVLSSFGLNQGHRVLATPTLSVSLTACLCLLSLSGAW